MSRLTDAQVRGKGTAVVVQNVEDLMIYHGKLKPLFSAPCDNWFEDIAPPPRKKSQMDISLFANSTLGV